MQRAHIRLQRLCKCQASAPSDMAAAAVGVPEPHCSIFEHGPCSQAFIRIPESPECSGSGKGGATCKLFSVSWSAWTTSVFWAPSLSSTAFR